MKSFTVILLSVLGSLIFGSSFAQELEIVVVNKTRKEIDQIFISPNEASRWSRDVLGRDVLLNMEQVKLDISEDYGSTCSFDLKVVYKDRTEAVWSELDFCKYLTFEIEPRGVVRFSEN